MLHIKPTLTCRVLLVTSVLALLLGAGACAKTRKTGSPTMHGFLGDYSQLSKDTTGRVTLVYVNPAVDWRSYNAIMIDSVTLWKTSKTSGLSSLSDTSRLSDKDGKMLTDHFYNALHDELGKTFQIVDRPGPGVMRVRGAITEAKGAIVPVNVATTLHGGAKVATTVAGLATDTQIWVGKATFEGEIRDSLTDVRLLAAVDERAGAKNILVGLRKWSDVKRALDTWAENLSERLSELRAE